MATEVSQEWVGEPITLSTTEKVLMGDLEPGMRIERPDGSGEQAEVFGVWSVRNRMGRQIAWGLHVMDIGWVGLDRDKADDITYLYNPRSVEVPYPATGAEHRGLMVVVGR